MNSLRPYFQIARVDHWFKNVFMIPGVALALLIEPATRDWANIPMLLLALLATCLTASSNYVINEIIDAKTDAFHPLKKTRPLASGQIQAKWAYVEWILLGLLGLGLGWLISFPFFLVILALWIQGFCYNVPPIRTKEVPVLDVLSEAINNPFRMLLGWYGIGALGFPHSSILLAYWLLGAFLMTTKRLAEYRKIGDPERAAQYRASFAFYDEKRLVASMLSYASGFMFFLAIIILKYHPTLVLACPFFLVYFAYYTALAFEPDSIVQTPERLVHHPKTLILTLILTIAVGIFATMHAPFLDDWIRAGGSVW